MDIMMVEGTPLFILQNGGGGGAFVSLFPLLLIFVIFYFLIIRPQQRKQRQAQKERDEMLNALKTGDKVVTSGGIYGTIVAVKESTVQLRIAQSVSIEVSRSAIAGPQGADIKEAEVAK
jgi:preprotein translocase subunit YajC